MSVLRCKFLSLFLVFFAWLSPRNIHNVLCQTKALLSSVNTILWPIGWKCFYMQFFYILLKRNLYIFVDTQTELCVGVRMKEREKKEWINKLIFSDIRPVGCSALEIRCQGIQLKSHAMYSMFCIGCNKYAFTVKQFLPELSSVHDSILFYFSIQ